MADKIRVCGFCLRGIKSRESNIITRTIRVDETDIEESKCDLCEESGFEKLYEIIRSE